MKTLRQKIKEITTYHSDEGTSGYLLSDKQIDAILEAVRETIPEAPAHPWDCGVHIQGDCDCGAKEADQYRLKLLKRLGVK